MDIRGTAISAQEDGEDLALLALCHALGATPDCVMPTLYRERRLAQQSVAALVGAVLDRGIRLPGVGPRRLASLAASLKLAEHLARESVSLSSPLDSPAACEHWLKLHLGLAGRERFSGLFLNAAHQVIATEDLFSGTINAASVHPRIVAERALRLGATAVIVAHNHPSGRCEPSQADVRMTRALQQALALLDIQLLDHLIVGGGQCVSLASLGYC